MDTYRPLPGTPIEELETPCLLVDLDAVENNFLVVAETYRDKSRWARMCALNIARVGMFSSDRTIRQYADEIWRIRPVSPTSR